METDRCRLVVTASPDIASATALGKIAETGAVYCAILHRGKSDQSAFASYCQEAVKELHAFDIPVLVADDSQAMGRSGADGLFLEKGVSQLRQEIQDHAPQRLIGCGGFKNRDAALRAGEESPDFVFFGKLGGDIRSEPHPKNMTLAQWWSEIVDIPCILMAGNSLDGILDCANTGADFVAVESAVFGHQDAPHKLISKAEAMLEEHAPRFEEAAV